MKTGATEAFEKLPTHLLTALQCVDDFLLFSDMDQNVGNYHVYNVLSDVASEVKQNLKEFDLYEAQANCPVSQKDCTTNMKGGWELDKYKFIHMIERAWSMRPNRKWYVFAEADSYIFWPNLNFWLNNHVTPEKHPYVGSVAMLKNKPFAHGGSGYVIAGETVKKMAETPGLAHKYDLMAPHECCGDYLMSLAVNETGIKVKQAHPMFNGEKPNTLPYGHGHWCEPLLTMHHMNSEEISSAWFYEQTRKKRGILQIKDMYETFMAPNLVPKREQFDNLSEDTCYIGADEAAQNAAGDREKSRQKKQDDKNPIERQAHQSPEHCSRVCMAEGLGIHQEHYDSLQSDSERFAYLESKYAERSADKGFNGERHCFQWRYHKNTCCVAKSFKLGRPRREEKVEDRWTSGWFVEGINKWIEAKGDCAPAWKML
ncbi:family 31 glycosyltransferase [Mariannaea sp. PMI_226]|nr:family 31 glycosyltransferase [Mariannaea sp. PMI_226]